jgi:hypothetical protein
MSEAVIAAKLAGRSHGCRPVADWAGFKRTPAKTGRQDVFSWALMFWRASCCR